MLKLTHLTAALSTAAILGIVCLIPSTSWARGGGGHGRRHDGSVYVHGYYRSNGTYVSPYIRSAPNSGYGVEPTIVTGYGGSSTYPPDLPSDSTYVNPYARSAPDFRYKKEPTTVTSCGGSGGTYATDTVDMATLNAQLQQAVCTQDWGGAAKIVDQMIAATPSSNQAQLTQLDTYRRRMQSLYDSKANVLNGAENCSATPPIRADF